MALGFGFDPTQSIEMSMNCRSPINNLSANQRPAKRLFGPPLALCIFGIERALVVARPLEQLAHRALHVLERQELQELMIP